MKIYRNNFNKTDYRTELNAVRDTLEKFIEHFIKLSEDAGQILDDLPQGKDSNASILNKINQMMFNLSNGLKTTAARNLTGSKKPIANVVTMTDYPNDFNDAKSLAYTRKFGIEFTNLKKSYDVCNFYDLYIPGLTLYVAFDASKAEIKMGVVISSCTTNNLYFQKTKNNVDRYELFSSDNVESTYVSSNSVQDNTPYFQELLEQITEYDNSNNSVPKINDIINALELNLDVFDTVLDSPALE